jgi:hypothetical protein
MSEYDRELEKYLSNFRPRDVRPLDLTLVTRTVWLKRLAAAAMLLLAVGTWLWYAGHGNKLDQETTKIMARQKEAPAVAWKGNTIVLTKMALEDPTRFEEQLDEESRRVLPDLRGQQSTLRVFAND